MADGVPSAELLLAPLKGFTDSAFRNAFSAHFGGFDSALAPFLTACPPERFQESMLQDLEPEENRRLPVEPQILGESAEQFLFLHRRLADLGYRDVNWNLGCPFRPVMRKARGAGLLPRPELIDRFLDRVVPNLSGRLSIKMRLGRSRAEEIFKLLPILNRYPLRAVIVHPRTARQMYAGPIDLAAFARFREHCRHPVVYNGEIRKEEDVRLLRERLGPIPAWMIGRGALEDPFLPSRLKGKPIPPPGQRRERFWAFHDELSARYAACAGMDPQRLLHRMKGFWTYFAALFSPADEIRRRLHRAARLEDWRRILEDLRAGDPGEDEDGAPPGADAPS